MNIQSPEKKYKFLYKEMYNLCKENGWGDPFSYARSREIYLAIVLDHQVSITYSGADGIDKNEKEVEYKSTIRKKITGEYSGISKKKTWEEQQKYLREEKIGKYHHHFFVRFEGPIIAEVYRLDADKVLNFIEPLIKKQFYSPEVKADPRFSAKVPEKYIKENGIKIDIGN